MFARSRSLEPSDSALRVARRSIRHHRRTADERLVFPWEADGWTHLYSIPAAGGAAALPTPGAFQVEHVSLSADRRELLFSSNQGDVERRHVWRVAAAGGKPAAITRGHEGPSQQIGEY